MATEIQKQASQVQGQIFDEQFYVPQFLKVLGRHGMSVASIDQSEFADKQLVEMFHAFWEELPDSPEIRRTPFFAICDIAQNLFDM